MDDALIQEVVARLAGDGSLPAPAVDVVLAALLGELDAHLGGAPAARPPAAAGPPPAPARAYLESITVAGFRGIGPAATLALEPGPGLTLVVGRNGSGKSSFAEALELLLTGDSRRWAGRNRLWREGWRNLHQGGGTSISARVLVDGVRGAVAVRARWDEGAELAQATTTVERPGAAAAPLASLGWEQALTAHRPFQSHNELGSMLEEGPSRLFDALATVLGLEDLVAAADALGRARREREHDVQATRARLDELRDLLARQADDRARRCLAALDGRGDWRLDEVEPLVAGGDADPTGATLAQLERLPLPEPGAVAAAVAALRAAATAVVAAAGTDAERCRRLADLLARALDLHRLHGDGRCPVCGRDGALDPDWRRRAEAEAIDLRHRAEAATLAHRQLNEAERRARALLAPPPPLLGRAAEAGLDAAPVAAAWDRWLAGRDLAGEALAAHLDGRAGELVAAGRELRARAAELHAGRAESWRPVAVAIASWLPAGRRVAAATAQVKALKAGEKWLRDLATELRNRRFQPIKDRVKAVWAELRTQSHVDLVDVTFEGTTTNRHVKLDVAVDGTGGVALGVMSQGELYALALSLFLPRATLASSPFGFLVIDDPVQAMDPARVDGLARALQREAVERQVVVFTHDDRLPRALRDLRIAGRVLEVLRQEGSVVTVREVHGPVRQYLDDAFALLKTDGLPPAVARRVVPGLCRQAVEAACLEVVRRRRLGRGEGHADVERLFRDHQKLVPRLALAVNDDPGDTGQLWDGIARRLRPAAAAAVKACNAGVHGEMAGDPLVFVREIERLTQWLRGLA